MTSKSQRASRFRLTLLCATFTLGIIAGEPSAADEPTAISLPKSWAALANEAPVRAPDHPIPDVSWDTEARKSYGIPAAEIIGFDVLLNLVNRQHHSDYRSNFSTIRRNLHSSWVVDSDPFKTNQLGHPYQ